MSTQDRLVADRFRIVRRLGSGAMASVFLAEDCELGRMVAIKRLHPESPAEIAPRFRREMRVAASVSHPNIVTLFDAIADDEAVLLVMEYVDGPTLAQRMRQGPIELQDALGMVRELAAAVDYLHARGVIHRDIKPANVLLDRDGRVKLTDLGIASAAEATGITTSGTVLGTPAYMAPELFDGERATAAGDVYSVAAIAYEMLSGRRAREGGTPAAIALRANDPPPDLREHLPEAPALAEALSRGMARDPAQRPASATELADALAEAVAADGTAGEPTVAMRVPPPAAERDGGAPEPAPAPAPQGTAEVEVPAARERAEPPPRRDRRAPVGLLAAAGALALAAIAAVVLAGGGGGDDPGRSSASTPRTTTTASSSRGETESTGTGTTQRQSTSPSASQSTTQRQSTSPSASQSTTQSQSTSSGSASPAPSAGAAAPSTGSPEGAVQAFYGRAAAHRYENAWALAAPSLRSQLGGFGAFRGQFSSVRSIRFARAQTVRRAADAATVAITTTATHTNRVDHCTGTADTAPAPGGGWVVTHLDVNC